MFADRASSRFSANEVSNPRLPAVVKQYDRDVAKERSRELLRHTIERELLPHIPSHKIEVLCLPGTTLAEIQQVYDPLNIPRKNILGLERDPAIVELQRSFNSGINIENVSVEDYFAGKSSCRFHVVNLDYTGSMLRQQSEIVRAMVRANSASRYVLHESHSARRDPTAIGLYASFDAAISREEGPDNAPCLYPIEKFNREALKQNAASNGAKVRMLQEGSAKTIRSDGLTSGLLLALDNPFDSRDLLKMFHLNGQELGNKQIKFIAESSKERGRPLSALPGDPNCRAFSPEFQFWLSAAQGILANRLETSGASKEDAVVVSQMLIGTLTSKFAYGATAIERYAYVSESGCPMIGDIISIRDHPSFRVGIQRLANQFREGFMNQGSIFQAMQEWLEFVTPYIDLRRRALESDRAFLGNASRPLLTKARALEELRAGTSLDEIRTKYRGAADKPLAQWKVHLTMGTYDPLTVGEEGDLLSKEDAIQLIVSGIPVTEIAAAYPGSFSIGQLRAFKAHVTMKSYD